MAILEIVEAPDPVLSKVAREVRPDEFGSELSRFVDDMAETMFAAPGVGLAAPQVSDSRRIVVADVAGYDDDGNRRKEHDLVALVNPRITLRSKESILWEESCLSLPEFYLDVKRPRRITVQFQDVAGNSQERVFEGFPSVVVQHELDHLDGTTLLDRASRLKRGRFLKRQKKVRPTEPEW